MEKFPFSSVPFKRIYNGREMSAFHTWCVRIDTNSGLCAARTISTACRRIRPVYARYARSRALPASNCMVSVY